MASSSARHALRVERGGRSQGRPEAAPSASVPLLRARVVTAAHPRILLFRVDDVPGHFEQVVATRGPLWIGKLVAYVEQTPVALANDWRGFEGFLRLWDAYQRLILDLAIEVKCPVLELQGWREGRGFAADDAFAFLNQ